MAVADAPIDRTRLPMADPAFKGTANRTLAGSAPDWGLIGHVTPPEGAPNVLLVLIDDAGFGQPEYVRRPDRHARHDPHRRRGRALQPVPRDGAVLADPGRFAHRP